MVGKKNEELRLFGSKFQGFDILVWFFFLSCSLNEHVFA
jgi:hypothetical protein